MERKKETKRKQRKKRWKRTTYLMATSYGASVCRVTTSCVSVYVRVCELRRKIIILKSKEKKQNKQTKKEQQKTTNCMCVKQRNDDEEDEDDEKVHYDLKSKKLLKEKVCAQY